MDLTQLRYFQAVAQNGSMTRAAKVLGVSQPTLTVAIRGLEERWKTTLLLRGRTGVTLTRTGEELLAHAREIFALLDRAEQRITGLEGDDIGAFMLGCHESLGAYFLPGFLREFITHSPRIEITLWNNTSAAVRDAVVAREVHFGIIVNPVPHPDLVLIELCRDAMDLFVLSKRDPTDPTATVQHSLESARELLRKGPLILADRVAQCRELVDLLAADTLLPTRMLRCGDLELVKSLALGDLGVAMLPRRVAAYNQPEGTLTRLHVGLPFIPDSICLAFRADMHRTRAAIRVKDALVEYGRRLPPV